MSEEVALSSAAQAGELLPETPYVGLVPYRKEDAPFFFGRDDEKQIVAGNLRASRLTILYGPSGVGKTSLLQAGVVHDLLGQVRANAAERPERAPFAICSFSAWRDEPLPALVESIRASVAEALGGQEPEPWRPGEPPAETLRAWSGRVRTLLVVLDQFEDYFLYHPEEDGEGSFFVEFPRLVNEPNLRVNFLLSIREDSWAKLDRFEGRIPRLFVNYVRVEHLDREAARQAIEEPVVEWNRRLPPEERPYTVEPAVVEGVIDAAAAGGLSLAESGGPAVLEPKAAGGYAVEAPFLQLVMERLWRATVAAGSRSLSLARLQELGGAQRIVENHLLEALAALTSAEQEVAADVFRFLVSPSKRKIAQSVPDLVEWTNRPELEVEGVLRKLSRSEGGRILRAISPPAGEDEASRYELYHDVLAEPILDWRRRYEHARDRRRTIRRVSVVGGALLALVAAFAGLAAWALVKQHEADRASRNATSLALASAAKDRLGTRLDESLLLGLEAYRARPSAQAATSMTSALKAARGSGVRTILRGTYYGNSPTVRDRPRLDIAFSTDGGMLAIPGWDGIELLDAHSLTRRRQPLDETSNSVALSTDGRTLASATRSGWVRLWDVRTGKQLGQLRHGSGVYDVAFSPDGDILASAGFDGKVRLWDVRTRAQGRQLRHGRAVSDLAFRPDGDMLASAGKDGWVRLWDVRTGQQRAQLHHAGTSVYGVAFSPDGRTLASAGKDGWVRLWDVRTGQQRAQLHHAGTSVYGVAFSPDGRTLASAGKDGWVRLWDVRTGQQRAQLHHENTPVVGVAPSGVYGVAFSPDGRTVASADWDAAVRLWDARTGERRAKLHNGSAVYDLSFSPDGRTLASAGKDGWVRLWDVHTREQRARLRLGGPIAFSPDGRTLAGAGQGWVQLWDVSTGERRAHVRHAAGVRDLAFSPDGRTLASAGEDGWVRLWNVRTREQRAQLRHGDFSDYVAFSPDGDTLASASAFDEGVVRLWDARTGEPDGQLRHEKTGPVSYGYFSIAFGPDGHTLAGVDSTWMWLWDVRTRKQRAQLRLGAPVNDLASSPSGGTLAGAGQDGWLRLWDVRTGEQRGQLRHGDTELFTVAFSPDGNTLASAGKDGTVRLWERMFWNDLAELERQVCKLVVGNLTEDEWEQLVPGLAYRTTCPS